MRRTIARAKEDLAVIVARDPSTRTRAEALLHPALPALWAHRVAHVLHTRGHRHSARFLAYVARAVTGGIEIHPAASLGRRVFIDHGAAVVIGETARVGDDVTIFHQVTLGAVGWWRDGRREPGARRHPVLGDRVVIGTNAIVLGPVTVGDDALVGAGSLVLTDVPPGARVMAPAAEIVRRPSAEDREDAAQLLRALATSGCW
ncbi:serine O-acetyltransferase [Streptomyces sp. LamerLS-316]|uniref:serine O-acetyltransferase EpsC n=1 Tax=unclassified Streptomyces TaxID=2593676 RepID=UPI000823AD41|nr:MULTISPECIES: serine O-acetyltransferase EpsC [unclassified Streptomyces]MYQ36745.1 serine acetyltransferase [Streptomyces sp. SID4921]SCK50845.1 serine O-acetyltransferase [Streptomyces sp. LamerLS-316]